MVNIYKHFPTVIVFLTFSSLIVSGYLFFWKPEKIRKACFNEKLLAIQKRHDDNLNFYFVSLSDVSLDEKIDAGRNRPGYVQDLNSRLDEFWGNVTYTDCLHKNGLKE